MKRKRTFWTPFEIEQLTQSVANGDTSADIARRLGRSAAAVDLKRSKLKLKKPIKLSMNDPIHFAQLIKFRMAGWKLKEIAKVFGVTDSQVSDILCHHGFRGFIGQTGSYQLRYQRVHWTEIELNRLRKTCGHFHDNGGFTEQRWGQIARQFPNRTLRAVRVKGYLLMKYWLSPDEIKERRHLREKYKRNMTVNWLTTGKVERR